MKNELINKNNIRIEDMIFEINGVQVMLDSDLAKLYCVETKRINEAVKNNIEKFPKRYYFRISESEYVNLKSKISTSSYGSYGGSRKGHNVFTEQGVYMLATILKSKVAINVTVNIIDAFVSIRKYVSNNIIEQSYINNLVLENRENIKVLQESFNKLNEKAKSKYYIL